MIVPAGFSLISVQHRHGRHQAGTRLALLEGWGELQGAIATSYSHDSHNLVVLGRDPQEMMLAANTLIASGGGMAVVQQGEVLAHVAMPIAGMLSDLPASELAASFHALREVSGKVVEWEPPLPGLQGHRGNLPCLQCGAPSDRSRPHRWSDPRDCRSLHLLLALRCKPSRLTPRRTA